MKIVRFTVVATFVVSLVIGILSEVLHPLSWKNAGVDLAVLLVLVGPAVGFLLGVSFWQRTFSVICALAAFLWGALPFIPTDVDRDTWELYIWGYFEALFIAALIVSLVSPKKKPNQAPEPTALLGRGSS